MRSTRLPLGCVMCSGKNDTRVSNSCNKEQKKQVMSVTHKSGRYLSTSLGVLRFWVKNVLKFKQRSALNFSSSY